MACLKYNTYIIDVIEKQQNKNEDTKMEMFELIVQTIATVILIGFYPFGFWYLNRKSIKSIDKRIDQYKNNNK